MDSTDTLLTTRQLQDLLQVDRVTIYRMLNDGRLQGFKVGGQWRFSRQAIERWLQKQQADLSLHGSPPAAGDLHPSAETLPLSCIQAIQDIFAEALEVGAVTTTVDGTPITSIANACTFCTILLDSQEGRRRCIASWRASVHSLENVLQLRTCHAGLCYVGARIEVQGQFIAAVQAGQFLTRAPLPEEGWQERIAALSGAIGLNARDLQNALAAVPQVGEQRQRQIPLLLGRVAETFSEIGQERLNLLGRLQRIAEISSV